MPTYTPTDPLYAFQWHYDHLSQSLGFGRLGIETIWDEYSGDGVHIGISDSAVDLSHPEWEDRFDGVTPATCRRAAHVEYR